MFLKNLKNTQKRRHSQIHSVKLALRSVKKTLEAATQVSQEGHSY